MHRGILGACAAAWLAAAPAGAQPLVADVDPTRSQLSAELCVLVVCDTDDSRVDGSFTVELDDASNPTAIRLHDFDLQLLDGLFLNPRIPFVFSVEVDVRNAGAAHAMPGSPGPWVALGPDGSFVFTDAPTVMAGTAVYDVTGTACTPLMDAGLPCNGTFDLADAGAVPAALAGTATIVGDLLTLQFDLDIEVPLEGVGSLAMSGTVLAEAALPDCPAPPERVQGLELSRADPDSLLFTWGVEPTASGGYRVYSVTGPADFPARGDNPAARLECETLDPLAMGCTDSTGLQDAAPLVFYQAVAACTDGSEGPN